MAFPADDFEMSITCTACGATFYCHAVGYGNSSRGCKTPSACFDCGVPFPKEESHVDKS